MMREWENREQFFGEPIQTCGQCVGVARDYVPLQLRPWDAVHGEFVIVEMQK